MSSIDTCPCIFQSLSYFLHGYIILGSFFFPLFVNNQPEVAKWVGRVMNQNRSGWPDLRTLFYFLFLKVMNNYVEFGMLELEKVWNGPLNWNEKKLFVLFDGMKWTIPESKRNVILSH